jgi:hypothetical protein
MIRLYGLLIRLYPARLADEFGDEMTAVVTQLQRGIRTESATVRMRFVLREVSGLLAGAVREHLNVRNQNLSGGSMGNFRFPRWTIAMMILMFCAVNIAIEKGRLAAVQLLGGQTTPHWWTLTGVFLSVSAVLGVIGCVGYAILHVVRTIRGTGA